MNRLTGEQKGALLLKNLPAEVVQAVLTKLPPDRRERLRVLMENLPAGAISRDVLDQILEDLVDALDAQRPKPNPVLSLRAYAETAASADAGMGSTTPRPAPSPSAVKQPPPIDLDQAAQDPLGFLAGIPADFVAPVLEGENPRTVCLLLNYFDVGRAGEIFKLLSSDLRQEVSVQFGSQMVPDLAVLKQVALALLKKIKNRPGQPEFPKGEARLRKMADMLRELEKPERLAILEKLAAKDPDAAEEVKRHLYRYEDLLRIDNRSLQKLLMDIETTTLAQSLREADEAIRDKVLGNLSKRAQENLKEELELSAGVRKEQIEQARKEIVAVIQRLDLAGEIVLL